MQPEHVWRETPELFLRQMSGGKTESFEVSFPVELGEEEREKDKDPWWLSTQRNLWLGNYYTLFPPTTNMWHSYSHDLVICLISPVNCPCHSVSSPEIGNEAFQQFLGAWRAKTNKSVPGRVCRHRFCCDIARMGFLEAADLHSRAGSRSGGWGCDTCGFRQGWERRQSWAFPCPGAKHETDLLPLSSYGSSTASEDEEQQRKRHLDQASSSFW